ncbi:MAG: ArsR family transcriptional regulator [Dehalococcoidia bacterium]|nr:MAG: ArsR family transcriptional regulator [Dehalococcoidia bacterium]
MASIRGPRSVEARAAVHAVLADPHRLAICDRLALSDLTPSELGEHLGIRSNLLAHHLATLASAGVTATTVSSGDGRRRYVHLRRDVLDGLMPVQQVAPSSVLFVCKHNSARSQLALALWRSRSSIPAESAGIQPAASVHPGAVRVAARHGLDLSDARPRSIQAINAAPALVVTVCDEANEVIEVTRTRLHWSIADPVASGRTRAFEDAFEALSERVAQLCAAVA